MGVGNEDPKWRSVNLGLSAKQIHQLLFIFTKESANFYEKSTFLVFLHSWSMKIIFAIEKALSKITSQNKLMLINLFHRQRPKCLNSFFLDSFMSRAVIHELSHICMCFWFWNRGWFSKELRECIFITLFVVSTPNE